MPGVAGGGVFIESRANDRMPEPTTKDKTRTSRAKKYWSADVTKRSNALDLESGVFSWSDPKRIARSLKRSAESSSRRKAAPFQSAMSMLNFYMNRAGKNLPSKQKRILEQAKEELRRLFNRGKTAAGS